MYGKTKDGVALPVLVDPVGALIASRGGELSKNTHEGNEYFAFCQSQDVALYTATAAIGLIVYNPLGSGVNLVWHLWTATVWATSIAMTGMVLAINTQPTLPTTVTAATLTGKTLLTGSTGLVAGSALAYSVATIIAPVIAWPLFHNTVAIAITGAEVISGDLKGAFASAPGTCTVIGALGAAGVTVDLGLTWEEREI
jgi:hypothetical protein